MANKSKSKQVVDYMTANPKASSYGLMNALIGANTKMKLKGRKGSTNIEDRTGPFSPDERDDNRRDLIWGEADAILAAMRNQNVPDVPLPRRRPDGFLDAGTNISQSDVDRWVQEGKEADWVNEHSSDFSQRQRERFLTFKGDYKNVDSVYQPEATQFLLDSFKRARETGLHKAMPYNKFEGGTKKVSENITEQWLLKRQEMLLEKLGNVEGPLDYNLTKMRLRNNRKWYEETYNRNREDFA